MPIFRTVILVLCIISKVAALITNAAYGEFTTGLSDDQLSMSTNDTVYVMVMLPYPDPLGRPSFAANYDDGHDITPAAFLAVEEINNCSDMLRGYNLKLILSDGGCSIKERTVFSYAKDLHHIYHNDSLNIPLIGVAGPGCDIAVDTILDLTTEKRTSIVSVHWGGADENSMFPNGFGIIGPDSAYASAYFELIQKNKWKKVAVLYSTIEAEGEAVLQGLQKAAKVSTQYNNVIQFVTEIYDNFIPLEIVRSLFLRVVIVAATPSLSRRLLCLAFYNGMVFPEYQWIFKTKTDVDFHDVAFSYNFQYKCSKEDILTALNGSLNIFQRFLSNAIRTISNHTHSEYQEAYRNQIKAYKGRFNVKAFWTPWSGVTYDSIWALALALNSTIDEFKNLSSQFRGSVLRKEIANVVRKEMLSIDFQGVTGRIKFNNKTHFIEPEFDIIQYNGSGFGEVVLIYSQGKLITLPEINGHFIESSFESHYSRLALSVSTPLLACVFIVFSITIAIQVVNTLYRKTKSIKASSHRLNHMILVGFYFILMGMTVYTVQRSIVVLNMITQKMLCNLVPWCISIGLTLVLGMVCLKTWRLYYNIIFTSKHIKTRTKTKQIFLKDYTLAIFQCVLIFIDVIVLVIWSVTNPLIPTETMSQNHDGTVSIESECTSQWILQFSLILGGGKMLILFFSLMFGLLARSRQIKEFETNNIVILVYLLSILAALGVPTYVIVSIQKVGLTVEVLVLDALLLAVMGVCFVTLFLPPIIPLIKYRNKLAPGTK